MKPNRYVLIMAGGIGSRFWPMSRAKHPKQFLDILNTGKTFLQQTYERVKPLCPKENIYVVTNESYINLVQEQLPEILNGQILTEPVARNTAACIAYGSFHIHKKNPDAVTLVAPSDHLILQEEHFLNTINIAFDAVEKQDILMTLGIKPMRPDTGYGYIQFIEGKSGDPYHKVKTFTEKPTLEIAKQFMMSGEFVWNSGIFVWRTDAILSAFKKYLEEIHGLFEEIYPVMGTAEETARIRDAYSRCRNISIDYGILEKAKNVYVIPANFGWSDLGTWQSIYEHHAKDYLENAVSGNVIVYDTTGCIVNVPKEKLVVMEGLKDYIVVEHENVLLICRMESEQKIKQFLADVKERTGNKYL